MAEPPKLPESNDPFKILGVSPYADKAQIKVAYFSLIKEYRPDRYPEEFKIIQKAYEKALAGRTPTAFQHWNEGHSNFLKSEGKTTGKNLSELKRWDFEWYRNWSLVQSGHYDETLDRVRKACKANPLTAWPYLQEFLVLEFMGRPFKETSNSLFLGLEQGADLVEWILAVLSLEERILFAMDSRCSWACFEKQTDHNKIEVLYRARIIAHLMNGSIEDLVSEMASAPFVTQANQQEAFRELGLQAAVSLAFQYPEQADKLYGVFAEGLVESHGLESIFELRSLLQEEWYCWVACGAEAVELNRIFEISHLLREDEMSLLCLSPLMINKTDTYLSLFDAMQDKTPAISRYLIEEMASMDIEEYGNEVTSGDLREFCVSTAKKIDSNKIKRVDDWLNLLLLLTSVAVFYYFGWWGVLPFVLTLISSGYSYRSVDRNVYYQIVRPMAASAIVKYRCNLENLQEAIQVNGKSAESLCRFTDDLEVDGPLYALSLAAAIGRPYD